MRPKPTTLVTSSPLNMAEGIIVPLSIHLNHPLVDIQADDSIIKLYGKWTYEGVKCQDLALKVCHAAAQSISNYDRITSSLAARSSCPILPAVTLPSASARPSAPSSSA